MCPKKTVKQLLEEKDNDYSGYEPFANDSPIPSSIIIPVYNNAPILSRTLENISQQESILKDTQLFEIIVVDDGSEEDISSAFESFPFRCAKYYVKHSKNLGRSTARNSGAKKSSKELLLFFDADVLLPSNYFKKVWEIHNSLRNVLTVGLAQNIYSDEDISEITNPDQITPDITDDFRYYKRFNNTMFGRKEFRLMEETDWLKQFGAGKRIGPWTLPKMVVTHNIGVRRDNFVKVGGFNEQFKSWGYEDTYLGAKLIASGSYIIPLKGTGILRILDRNKERRFSDENRLLYERLIGLTSI